MFGWRARRVVGSPTLDSCATAWRSEALATRSRRILIVCNAMSGRGRAAVVAASAERALEVRGHTARVVDARAPGGDLEAALGAADAVAIAGGDGTVLHALPMLARAGAPIYHLGTGNENLLARQLGHACRAGALAAAVDAWRVDSMDLGVCERLGAAGDGGTRFATMLSVGPDASIVHRLAARRRGTVWHGSYVVPTLAEAARPALPELRVEVDGRVIAEGVRGMAIVANTPQYAVRLDPAHGADAADGLLDVVVLPARSIAMLAWRLGRSRLRRHGPRVVRGRGSRIAIATTGGVPAAVQLDGEAPGVLLGDGRGGLKTPIVAEARPGALRVLQAPPAAARRDSA